MIDSLRFIERTIKIGEQHTEFGSKPKMGTVKILQYTDGYNWFDVPLVKEEKDV